MTSEDRRRQAETSGERRYSALKGQGQELRYRPSTGQHTPAGTRRLRARASLASNLDSFSGPYLTAGGRDRALFRIVVCRPLCGERDALHTHVRGPRRTAHARSRTETHCTRTFEDRCPQTGRTFEALFGPRLKAAADGPGAQPVLQCLCGASHEVQAPA